MLLCSVSGKITYFSSTVDEFEPINLYFCQLIQDFFQIWYENRPRSSGEFRTWYTGCILAPGITLETQLLTKMWRKQVG